MPNPKLSTACAAAACLVLLSACALAPAYAPPPVATPAAFKEATPWQAAQPLDTKPRGAWWTMFGDPVLDDLEARALAANPTLAQAVAAYDQARSLTDQARSARFPEVDGLVSGERLHRSDNTPLRTGGPDTYSDLQAGVSAAYEIDLWGRVRSSISAAKADQQASAADLESVRLSLQAQLADAYLSLRELDAQGALLADTAEAYDRALRLIQIRNTGGSASGLDVARAQTQLSTARAQTSDVAGRRALLEHAIAALVGEPASTFALPASTTALQQPQIPAGTPAVLLQRRPDVAGAERRAAAANARIGVAQAARFPGLTLGGAAGWRSAGGVSLLSAPNTFWMIGPQLAGAIFDGGRRRAGVETARAEFRQSAAAYRGTVLDAFRDVEDQLALAHHLADEAVDQAEAVSAARRQQDLALVRYRQGASDYLSVVVAQTAALDAERADLNLRYRRLRTSVDLTRALGGPWSAASQSDGPSEAQVAPGSPATAQLNAGP